MAENGEQPLSMGQMMPSAAEMFGMWNVEALPIGPFDMSMPEMPSMPQLNPWADGFNSNASLLDGYDPSAWGAFPGPFPDFATGMSLPGLHCPEMNGHMQMTATSIAVADTPLELDTLAQQVAEGVGLDDLDDARPKNVANGMRAFSLDGSLLQLESGAHSKLLQKSGALDVLPQDGSAADDDDDEEAHPLAHSWGLWVLMAPQRRGRRPVSNWTDGQRLVHGFSTVEGFWRMIRHVHAPSTLQEGVDFSVFREGIMPDWEDAHCAGGGRWLAQMKNVQPDGLDAAWLAVCLACIGGSFGEAVLGCVVSVRNGASRIAIWVNVPLKHRSRLLGIGGTFRTSLGDVAPEEVLYEDFKDGKPVLALSAFEHREVFEDAPVQHATVPRKGGERGVELQRGERNDRGYPGYQYEGMKGKGKGKWK